MNLSKAARSGGSNRTPTKWPLPVVIGRPRVFVLARIDLRIWILDNTKASRAEVAPSATALTHAKESTPMAQAEPANTTNPSGVTLTRKGERYVLEHLRAPESPEEYFRALATLRKAARDEIATASRKYASGAASWWRSGGQRRVRLRQSLARSSACHATALSQWTASRISGSR